MSRTSYKDPEEFALIRSMYFNPPTIASSPYLAMTDDENRELYERMTMRKNRNQTR